MKILQMSLKWYCNSKMPKITNRNNMDNKENGTTLKEECHIWMEEKVVIIILPNKGYIPKQMLELNSKCCQKENIPS